ncbi:MAG: septal ring lytic transglycosylase RlpA family protein [Bacteroidales bacterium]|nr:septal ring lytic transglycosylase RlpA family protein [Bacteroidales bacterium]
MVVRRCINTLLLLLLAAWPAAAQNYSADDTVTEYPNKGTYYHDRFEGRKTANGEIFDQNKFTAAHWKIKLGTYALVTNRNNGMQVIVWVNDRCPKRGVFDMSHRAANAIGIKGMQPVTVRLLQGDWHDRWAAQETMFDSVSSRLNPAPKEVRQKSDTATTEPKPEVAKSAPATTPAATKQHTAKHHHTANQSHSEERYDILLGMAATHGDAFNMIEKLPEIYREKVLVETLEDETLRLTLDVGLPKDNAEELCRALRRTFKEGKVIPSE